MKKSKLLILTAALLVTVMLFGACAGSHKRFFDGETYADENPSVTAAAQVEALLGATYTSARGDLVYLVDTVLDGENTYQKNIVYNLSTGTVVLEATTTLTIDIDIVLGLAYDDHAYFTVKTTSWQLLDGVPANYETKTSLCAANGTIVAEASEAVTPTVRLDLIEFDGKCYRVADDGSIAHAFDLGDFKALPTFSLKTEEFYYHINSSAVFVYDLNCTLVSYYEAPDYAATMVAFPLAGGDVLIQYIVAEPDDAEDYTFLLESGYSSMAPGKYTLHSLLLKAGKDKTKELDLDYYILNMQRMTEDSWTETYGLGDASDNIATALEIVDRRVDASTLAYKAVSVSNSGKVRSELRKLVTAQATVLPSLVATNRWTVTDAAARKFLIDEKGNVVGEITNAIAQNESYFLAGGKLYDYDLNVAYDYEVAKLEVYSDAVSAASYTGVLNHGVLLKNEDGEIICYANGAATTVIAKDAARTLVTVRDAYFVVCDNTDAANPKYDVYNDVGTKIVTLDYEPTIVATGENGVLLLRYVQADSKSVYYRFS